MDNQPLISIIIPTYNENIYIDEAIQSVLDQSLQDFEILLIDDYSVDGSYEKLASRYSDIPSIKIFRAQANGGAAHARNIGIKNAAGRFIAFLDSDDLWLPTKLEQQIKFMLDNDYAFSYTDYEKIDQNGKSFQTMNVPARVSYNDLLKTNVIGCLTAVYDSKKLGKIYMPTNNKREDFLTWLNIVKKIEFAYSVPTVLAKYRVYANQSSAKKINMAKENWNLYFKIEDLGLVRSIYYFGNYAIRGLVRNKLPKIAAILGW